MWASANTTHHKLADDSRAIPVASSDLGSAKAYGTASEGGSTSKDTDTTQASTLVVDDDDDLFETSGPGSVKTSQQHKGGADLAEPRQMQQLNKNGAGAGIDVSRTFSIRSD